MAYYDKYGVEFLDNRKRTLVRCPQNYKGKYTIPNEIVTIENWAFKGCVEISEVVIPNGVTNIGREAFLGCNGITSIELPDTIKYIGYYAFGGCKLHSVRIPKNVTWIGHHAFGDTGTLDTVIWDAEHCSGMECTQFDIISPFAKPEKIMSFSFGEDVKYVPEAICAQMTSLKSIVCQEGVIDIGPDAFKYCFGLKAVSLPNSVSHINESSFARCDNLQKIIVPKGQKERFARMDGLKSLVDKIVECEDTDSSAPKRSWEDCEQLWREKYAEYAKQESEFARLIIPLLERNAEPSTMPPVGICLTAEEYVRFKAEGRDFKRIHAWCWSGHDIHERMRLHLNPVNIQHEYCVGVKTPRKGLYKVIEKHDAMLRCYYLGKEVRNDQNELDFLEETVEINSNPLFNYNSIGPKDYSIEVGDIIRVDDNRLVSSPRFNSKTYAITWSFGNVKAKKPSVVDDDYDDYDSHVDYSKACYDQYGGYNGFDDDTINSAFEGDPEATWNVD